MNVMMMSQASREKFNAYPEDLEEGFHLGGFRTGTVVKFNNRGNLLAVGCYDGLVKIFDYDTFSMVTEFRVCDGLVMCLDWFQNYRYLLCGGFEEKVTIWDIVEKQCVKSFDLSGNLLRSYVCPTKQ